jgi:hypothetical protein
MREPRFIFQLDFLEKIIYIIDAEVLRYPLKVENFLIS